MSVDTDPVVLTGGEGPGPALVYVLVTLLAPEAGRAGAGPLASHLVGVAPRSGLTRIDDTLVIQVTQQPRLPVGTHALVLAHLVHAGATILAGIDLAIVLVLFAVRTLESIDTDALIASLSVAAGPVVLARVVEGALVHVLQTVSTGPVWGTLAGVSVDTIDTGSVILTNVSLAIINIDFTVRSGKSTLAGAVVLVSPGLGAHSSVIARSRITGVIDSVTILPSPSSVTVTLVSAVGVLTPAVLAGVGQLVALVDVEVTAGALEAGLAFAPVALGEGHTLSPVPTRIGGAVVNLCAIVPGPSDGTRALERVES